MREWIGTIDAVDDLVAQAVGAAVYAIQHEQRFTVTDTFDNGPECLKTASSWRQTRIPRSLASRLETTHTTVTVEQEVRLRLLRCAAPTP